MKKKILVVDDDPHIREVVRFALEQGNYAVEEASDGRQGLERFGRTQPDLLVLDVLMPEMDGLELCREIRKSSRVPILFLSSKADEIDRILGLEIGGDDYLSKPFSPRELAARVRVILKRSQAEAPAEEAPAAEARSHGKIRLDPESHSAAFGKKAVELTATEFSLLQALMGRPGKVFSRENLMEQAYQGEALVSDRTIDSHVRGVRDKFGKKGCASVIETVHGVGYRLGSGE